MRVTVRTWRKEDTREAWKVLREGGFSNVWPSFLVALRRPLTVCVTFVLIAVCIATSVNVWKIVMLVVGLFLFLYMCSLAATTYFLYGSNFADMQNVQRVYFESPDHYFWVAEMNGEIVGTIAVVDKQAGGSGSLESRSVIHTDTDKKVYQQRHIASGDDVISIKTAWLRRMAVKRKYRGLGIAKQLVSTAIQFCRERDYHFIFLITTEIHQPARALYTSMGFRQRAFRPYKYMAGLVSVWTYELEMQLR